MIEQNLSNMNIQIMRIIPETMVDGPGWRVSVYCAGCRHECLGCHNRETWPFTAGRTMTVDEVFNEIARCDGNVTFSGGDPMFQAEAFTALSKRIREELHRTIWCYTGFTYEEVLNDPKMRLILPYLEVLVDGRFDINQRDTSLLFRGSRNQRLIDVQSSLEKKEVVIYDYNPYPDF